MDHFLLRRVERFWTYILCGSRGLRLVRGTAHGTRVDALRAIFALRAIASDRLNCHLRQTPGGSLFFTINPPARLSLATSNYFDTEHAALDALATVQRAISEAPLVEDHVNRMETIPSDQVTGDPDDLEVIEPLCRLESLGAGFVLTVRTQNRHTVLGTIPTPTRASTLTRLEGLVSCGPDRERYSLHLSDLGRYSFRLRNRSGEVFATSALFGTPDQRDAVLAACITSIRRRGNYEREHRSERTPL